MNSLLKDFAYAVKLRLKNTRLDWKVRRTILRYKSQISEDIAEMDKNENGSEENKRLQKRVNHNTRKILALSDRNLYHRALRYAVHVPDEAWLDQGMHWPKGILKTEVRVSVQTQIREAKRSSVELWIKVIGPILTAAASLFGAYIGAHLFYSAWLEAFLRTASANARSPLPPS
jgi:hypothetical protein